MKLWNLTSKGNCGQRIVERSVFFMTHVKFNFGFISQLGLFFDTIPLYGSIDILSDCFLQVGKDAKNIHSLPRWS